MAGAGAAIGTSRRHRVSHLIKRRISTTGQRKVADITARHQQAVLSAGNAVVLHTISQRVIRQLRKLALSKRTRRTWCSRATIRRAPRTPSWPVSWPPRCSGVLPVASALDRLLDRALYLPQEWASREAAQCAIRLSPKVQWWFHYALTL